jgi:hypothetical protein
MKSASRAARRRLRNRPPEGLAQGREEGRQQPLAGLEADGRPVDAMLAA